MPHLVPRKISIILFTLLTTLLTAGCPKTDANGKAAARKPVALNIVAIDRSGSTQHMRPHQVAAFRAAFARASRWGEEVGVYVVDSKSVCIFEPQKTKRGVKPSPSVIKELETPPPDRATKTRPALFWEQMVREYADQSGQPIRILYLTDGGNDWYGEEKRVSASVEKLAANPDVSVALLGLNADLAESVKKQFAAFDKDRFRVAIGADKGTLLQGVAAWRAAGEKE